MADTRSTQDEIVQQVRDALDAMRLEDETLKVLVAVSGGVDSMVLLSILSKLQSDSILTVAVGHVNHGLRKESESEARFVERFVKERALTFFCENLPEKPSQANVEAWARKERYRALEEMRRRCGATVTLTAHHQRDQAETLLMRTISGRAMTDSHSVNAYCPERCLMRPLLGVSRKSIELYAKEHDVPFIVDASNKDLSRTRNYLRRQLMPQIRRDLNPSLDETLAELAARFSSDEDYFELEAEGIACKLEVTPRLEDFAELPAALCWRVCRKLATRACGEAARSVGYRAYNFVAVCIAAGSGGGDLGHGVSFMISQGNIEFFPTDLKQATLEPAELEIPGAVCRAYSDGSQAQILARVSSVTAEDRSALTQDSGDGCERAFFDLEAIFSAPEASNSKTSLIVRERQDGDVVRVESRGQRKLKKLLQERGVMLTLRDRIPIVELDSRILWVPGIARSEFAAVGAGTREMLVLEYRHHRPFSNL